MEVFAEHGIARTILSDNGQPYSGTLLRSLAQHLNVNQRFTPAYNPQSNGQVDGYTWKLYRFIYGLRLTTKNLG